MRARLAPLVALCVLVPVLGAVAESPSSQGNAPKFNFGATLQAYEPLSDRQTREAGLLYAWIRASWSHKGWGAKAEARATSGRFRPYFEGSFWLDHAYAFVTTKVGDVQVGQVGPAFIWEDETFSGDLASANGLTRNPEFGIALEGEKRFGYDTLAWRFRYAGQNDRVAWEDDGRGVESDPEGRLRDGFQGSASYLLNKGLWTLRPALSAGTARVRDTVTGDTAVRLSDAALSVRASFGPIALGLQGTVRDGDGAVSIARGTSEGPRFAYDDFVGLSVTVAAEFPTVIYRYSYSTFQYRGTDTSEDSHQPSVIWRPRKFVEGIVEYAHRRLDGGGIERTESAFRFALGLSF